MIPLSSAPYVNTLESAIQLLHSPAFCEAHRRSEKDFTRASILSLPAIVTALLSGIQGAVQAELNLFFPGLRGSAISQREVSRQAFAKARSKVKTEAFWALNDHMVSGLQAVYPTTWFGFRPVAADASTVQLVRHERKISRHYITAQVFTLYATDLEMTVRSHLYPEGTGERQMLVEHLAYLQATDLLLADRGYPACWLFSLLTQRKIQFCVRADATGFKVVADFMASGEAERTVQLAPANHAHATDYEFDRTPTTVRLVRISAPDGTADSAVITSLLDTKVYPAKAFRDLYHKRWRIEEAYKRIKHKIGLEWQSGLSWLAMQQDLAAKCLCDTLNAFFCAWSGMRARLKKNRAINRTHAFSTLKRRISAWLMKGLPGIQTVAIALTELARETIRRIPGQSKPRLFDRKSHLRLSYKRGA